VLIVLSTLGMLMLTLISAADLIALYLGLELMSLPLYVVAASHRTSLRSTEAGLKYFVLGALSSGMLLYGASLVYGFTGTVSFAGIAHSAAAAGTSLIFGLVFLFAGFCFKVSAVPVHMWTPDVYEGAPTLVTAFFAVAVKAAGIAMFVRTAIVARRLRCARPKRAATYASDHRAVSGWRRNGCARYRLPRIHEDRAFRGGACALAHAALQRSESHLGHGMTPYVYCGHRGQGRGVKLGLRAGLLQASSAIWARTSDW
jgi:Proton-conducting membrane transporter